MPLKPNYLEKFICKQRKPVIINWYFFWQLISLQAKHNTNNIMFTCYGCNRFFYLHDTKTAFNASKEIYEEKKFQNQRMYIRRQFFQKQSRGGRALMDNIFQYLISCKVKI
jgi:hypothetical protein